MSQIIHMQTDEVHQVAVRLQNSLVSMQSDIQHLGDQIYALDWSGAVAEEYTRAFAELTRQFSRHLDQGLLLGERLQRELAEWEIVDGQGSQRLGNLNIDFAAFQLSLAGLISRLNAPATQVVLADIDGAVLGTSASSFDALVQQYQQISWQEKFSLQNNLAAEISNLETQLAAEGSLDVVNQQIEEIEQHIGDLEEKIRQAQGEADSLFNRIIPEWPLQRDDDGWGLRTLSDDFEDEVAGYQNELDGLRNQLQELNNTRDRITNLQQTLNQTQEQQHALNQVFETGVPADGPTQPNWLRNQLGGCTHYVAEKRNVQPWPNPSGEAGHPNHACQWNDQAVQAGYEVGNQPVRGAIAVFEPGVMGADKSAGHVAYVEGVVREGDHYKVTISEAGTLYDANGNFIRGTHSAVGTREITIPANGENGVSFIYE